MRCCVAARACFAAADWLSGCCCWDPEQPPATTVTTTTKLDLIRRLRQSFDTAPILCRKADVVKLPAITRAVLECTFLRSRLMLIRLFQEAPIHCDCWS